MLLQKLETKKEVEISLIVFEYIYRNINVISVVKDGKVVIINDDVANKAKRLFI